MGDQKNLILAAVLSFLVIGLWETFVIGPQREEMQRNAEILGRIPANRWGDPDDLGGAAVFLSSDAANYVHGHILAVDGGWLAR